MTISGSAQEANAYQCQHTIYRNLSYILVYVRHSLFTLFK